MSKDLQERLRLLRNVQGHVDPDEAWVRATRETILMQVRNSLPSEPLSWSKQISQAFRSFRISHAFQWVRGPAVAVISVFLVVLGSSVASVSAADRSLPGDFLYSLKLVAEQAQLAMTSTKEEKLKLKIEFTQRRGEELKRVVTEDVTSKPARVEQTAEILKRDLDTVKQQLDDVKQSSPASNVVEVAKLVDQASNTILKQLQETKSSLPDVSIGKVIEAQAVAADTGVNAIEVMMEKQNESPDAVLATDVAMAVASHAKTVADATGVLSTSTIDVGVGAASGTATTEQLGQFVQQMKVATQQAFADAVASSTALIASSTAALLDNGSSSSSTNGDASSQKTDTYVSSTSSSVNTTSSTTNPVLRP